MPVELMAHIFTIMPVELMAVIIQVRFDQSLLIPSSFWQCLLEEELALARGVCQQTSPMACHLGPNLCGSMVMLMMAPLLTQTAALRRALIAM